MDNVKMAVIGSVIQEVGAIAECFEGGDMTSLLSTLYNLGIMDDTGLQTLLTHYDELMDKTGIYLEVDIP